MEDLLSRLNGGSVPPPYGGRPKFVKLAPDDDGSFLPHIFFEDPRTFEPKLGSLGQIHHWGLFKYSDYPENVKRGMQNLPDYDGVQAGMRRMLYQLKYDNALTPHISPEKQFMSVILEKKRLRLQHVDLADLEKCDVIVKIVMPFTTNRRGEPRIWRRVQLSAGIKLSVLQDKVISPVMGWVRNLHAYTFIDFRDGALFGPDNMTSIDVSHIEQVGYAYLPDDKYMLAHLFSKEKDKVGYLYDFGDKWNHELVIEKIISAEESDGGIKILDGNGMCPGENMTGCFRYHDKLLKYEEGTYAEKAETKREVLQCPNYKDYRKPPALFDPFSFDLTEAQKRLEEALASANSVRKGARKFHIPVGAGAFTDGMDAKFLKKGQSVVDSLDPESNGFWRETISNVKDRRAETVCAQCGKPGDASLKACGGCKQVLYCCPQHQKAHWKKWHKTQCSRKYLEK